MTLPRRTFTLIPVAALLPVAATAQAKPLDEKDPAAVALGYAADAKKVDKAKWPKFAAGQLCSNCAL
jgi:High potential iron-sulfur protein